MELGNAGGQDVAKAVLSTALQSRNITVSLRRILLNSCMAHRFGDWAEAAWFVFGIHFDGSGKARNYGFAQW